MPKFRAFMLNLARQFKEEDLSQLKYALKDKIPARKREQLREPLDVFLELEERNIVGPGKLQDLRELLEDIDRPHLLAMVDDFDDAGSSFPLKLKTTNYLELYGYRVAIKGGRHFETTEGEFVEVRSGANYALSLTNTNNHRCVCKLKIDGYEMFPNGFLLFPKQEVTIERPFREKTKFMFFAIADAPEGSGINKWREDKDGMIQIVFTPERADMKVACVARGSATQVLSCSCQTTDSDFYEMVSQTFGATCATIMVKWKLLGKRGVPLTGYGIQNGSQVDVNLGGRGGVSIKAVQSVQKTPVAKKNVKWRAGATTLEGESKQEFVNRCSFPQDPIHAAALNLRLVVRENEIPLPSSGRCTPLTRATLIPSPVPI